MRNHFPKFLTIIVLGTMLCLPSLAMAWTLSATFIENGTDPYTNINYGQFNKIEVFMVDGTTFNDPFIQAASVASAGWTSTLVNPDYSLATGTLTSLLGPFTVELPDPATTSHVLDYLVYRDNTLLYSQRVTWNGTGTGGDYYGWSFPTLPSNGSTYTYDGTSSTYDRNVVPLPPSLVLLGSGLLGLVLLRRRRESRV